MLDFLHGIAPFLFPEDMLGLVKLIMTFVAFVLFAGYIRWLMR